MSYLTDLALRLAAGAAAWPEDFRRRHAGYLLAAQRTDGGFAGRQGGSDLYYTSFGLRGLGLVGALDGSAACRAGEFLRSRLGDELPSVELYSLVLGAAVLAAAGGPDTLADADRAALGAAIDALRHEDGGFAKRAGQPSSSTYHTFLAVMSRKMLGLEPDPPEPISELIFSRRRDDGGFAEIPQLRTGGTNPTAAALAILKEIGWLDEPTRRDAMQFLAAMQNAEGGFRANARIPLADLLSTFTALTALATLDALPAVDRPAAAAYARSLEQPGGGFRGGVWDDATDVEYTFYGLGALALVGG